MTKEEIIAELQGMLAGVEHSTRRPTNLIGEHFTVTINTTRFTHPRMRIIVLQIGHRDDRNDPKSFDGIPVLLRSSEWSSSHHLDENGSQGWINPVIGTDQKFTITIG